MGPGAIDIDIETFSDVDLGRCGAHKYAESPAFDVLLVAWSDGQGPPRVADLASGEPMPASLIGALADGRRLKRAYNAEFERVCLGEWLRRRGLPGTPASSWRCSRVLGLSCGLSGGLADMGEAAGVPQGQAKLREGRALVELFCRPCGPTARNGRRRRALPGHEPEKWEAFRRYCAQDVEAEKALWARLAAFEPPEREWELWALDQRIGDRGVLVDLELARAAVGLMREESERLLAEAARLTGARNPNSVPQLRAWLEGELGEGAAPDLRAGTVDALLAGLGEGKARRALEIRKALSKASAKKFEAMADMACADGRVRGASRFHGARTGRWSGRGVQLQNLPRAQAEPPELARRLAVGRRAGDLRLIFGGVGEALAGLARHAVMAPPGKSLLAADFSAIEARVLAWLAGEGWRLSVFRGGGGIYEASASAMFGVPEARIAKGNPEHALRQKGKVAELALGYQGGKGALISMGALGMGIPEEELPDIVARWRAASPAVAGLWGEYEAAAADAVRTGRARGARGALFALEGGGPGGPAALTARLPSGRKLKYLSPRLEGGGRGGPRLSYLDGRAGRREATYGGKLVENVTQAVARDCLAEALFRLDALGFDVRFHVHDEAVAEGSPEWLGAMEAAMSAPAPWAPGLPLRAEGFAGGRYAK